MNETEYDLLIYIKKQEMYNIMINKINNNLKEYHKQWTLNDSQNTKKIKKKLKILYYINNYITILKNRTISLQYNINKLKKNNINQTNLLNLNIKHNLLNHNINHTIINHNIKQSYQNNINQIYQNNINYNINHSNYQNNIKHDLNQNNINYNINHSNINNINHNLNQSNINNIIINYNIKQNVINNEINENDDFNNFNIINY